MPTLAKEFGIDGVTLTTDVPHPRDTRRRGAVVAVTVIARGCGQVSFARHHFPVNALFVLSELVSRNFIRLHVFRVRVTGAARISDMQRMNG